MSDTVKVTLSTGAVVHTSAASAQRLAAMAGGTVETKPKAKAKAEPTED